METEFKLRIPPERLKAVEAALRRGAVETTRLQARYYDTAEGALAAAGVALRLRKEGRRWVQTAKAAGAGPVQRLEHNAELGAAAAPALPDLARHAGTPVGERLAQVLAQAGEAPLVQTYGTDVRRLTRIVRHAGATVELALDVGRVVAPAPQGGPPRAAPICELELELLSGPVSGLAALAALWAQRHGLWLSTVSKAERGERLMQGDPPPRPAKAAPPDFAPFVAPGHHAPDGAAVQRAVVAACLAQILPNAAEVAEGRGDAEVVHQLRIGIRRLRVALRELAALAPGFDPGWEAPLAEAFRALGAQRDRELVLAEAWAALRQAGAPEIDLLPSADTSPSPADAVRAPALQAALVALAGFAASPAAPAALDAGAA
ncbi:MAG: CYTH domain-containing protein, partial [Xenophilus sp.]